MLLVLKNIFTVFSPLSIFVISLFTGCGGDKSPVESQEPSYFITVKYGSSSIEVNLDELNRHNIDGVEAVKLSDLIDTSIVTESHNHAYRIIGKDGFYAHMKGNPDNTWEQLQWGYILLPTMRVSFDPSLELQGSYNIKDMVEMKILRKVDLVTPADSLIQFIIEDMTQTAFKDSLTGIKLTEFIPSDIVDDPRAFSYDLIAADEYSVTISYEQLLEGYYVIEYDRVLYSNPEI